MPIIPATWEAEAGELLEPGKWRLQWAKHSSLGNKNETLSQKKNCFHFSSSFNFHMIILSDFETSDIATLIRKCLICKRVDWYLPTSRIQRWGNSWRANSLGAASSRGAGKSGNPLLHKSHQNTVHYCQNQFFSGLCKLTPSLQQS